MKRTTLRRTGAAAAATLTLSFGLAACGSSDSSTTDTGSGSGGSSSSMDSSDMSGMSSSAAGGSDIASQVFGPACSQIPSSGSGSLDGMVQDPVATAASNNPLLGTLVKAVTAAGLVDTLNSAPSLTVFAPTDDAFKQIPPKTLNSVLANKKVLTQILTHHVIGKKLDPQQIVGTQDTLNKDTVTVKGDTNGMTVDGANVLCGNIPTKNATVYVIDQVLMPKGM